jgi:hypothetical protein
MFNLSLGIVIGIGMMIFFPDMQDIFVSSGLRDLIVEKLNGV